MGLHCLWVKYLLQTEAERHDSSSRHVTPTDVPCIVAILLLMGLYLPHDIYLRLGRSSSFQIHIFALTISYERFEHINTYFPLVEKKTTPRQPNASAYETCSIKPLIFAHITSQLLKAVWAGKDTALWECLTSINPPSTTRSRKSLSKRKLATCPTQFSLTLSRELRTMFSWFCSPHLPTTCTSVKQYTQTGFTPHQNCCGKRGLLANLMLRALFFSTDIHFHDS